MKNLEIKHSVSKGRETYGYNIITLIDGEEKYKTCGGGYDMVGTVFAYWLQQNHMKAIIDKLTPYERDNRGEYYGFFVDKTFSNKYYLDGGCGIDSIMRIAKAIGLEIKCLYSKKGLTNILVEETCLQK